jgi:tRNA threonylcarbamoyl adenosine modification protein (Sua5/YciO/YrdC/YwlC family)
MIEYVIEHNPDDRVLKKAAQALEWGGLICFPTDTNWIVAAFPFSKEGLEKLYRLKGETPNKHFSLLCNSVSMASEVAIINDQSFKVIRQCIPGHFTFIFEATKKVTKCLKASKADKEIGIRFPPGKLVYKLIETSSFPLISTNITHQMLGLAEDEPIYSYHIEDKLSHCLDMIIDPGEFEFAGPSTIISLCSAEGIEILREGAGDLDLLA